LSKQYPIRYIAHQPVETSQQKKKLQQDICNQKGKKEKAKQDFVSRAQFLFLYITMIQFVHRAALTLMQFLKQ
jgi:hypothetical protein